MYNTPYCQIQHLKEKNAILCTWKQFCKGEDYQEPFLYGLELIKKHNISTWITDTTHGFENEEADTVWLLQEIMPQFIESSLEKIVFVIANDSPLMGEILGQKEVLEEFFEVELVKSLDSIKDKASYYFSSARKHLQNGEFEKAIEIFTYLINNPSLECYEYFASDRGLRAIAACAEGKFDIAQADIEYISSDYVIYLYSIEGKIDKKRLEASITTREKLKTKSENNYAK